MLGAILLIAQPLLRDVELRTDELFFTTPMRKGDYLWGRALRRSARDARRLRRRCARHGDRQRSCRGSIRSGSARSRSSRMLWAFGVLVIPNLIFVGALLCLLAVTTRRLLVVVPRRDGGPGRCGRSPARWRAICSTTPSRRLIDPFGAAPRRRDHALLVRDRAQHARSRTSSGLLLLNRVIWLASRPRCSRPRMFAVPHAAAADRASARQRRAGDAVDIAAAASVGSRAGRAAAARRCARVRRRAPLCGSSCINCASMR